MILKEEINQLIGKKISVRIRELELFPFGFKPTPNQFTSPEYITIQEHSPGYYCVMKGNLCIFLFGIVNVKKFTVSYDDNEIYDIKWDDFRIVNLENI